MVCRVSLVAAHRLGIWDISFLTRDGTEALGSESAVSLPLTARDFCEVFLAELGEDL